MRSGLSKRNEDLAASPAMRVGSEREQIDGCVEAFRDVDEENTEPCWKTAVLLNAERGVLRCPSFAVGPDSFDEIETRGLICPDVRRLLERTTLSSVRRNRTVWSYGGITWELERLDDVSSRISGTGTAVPYFLTALWAKT
jgi:hypothetical protein